MDYFQKQGYCYVNCYKLMASGGSKRDPAWEHGILTDGNKNRTICKYCGIVMKSGGVIRLKYHLSIMDPSHNV